MDLSADFVPHVSTPGVGWSDQTGLMQHVHLEDQTSARASWDGASSHPQVQQNRFNEARSAECVHSTLRSLTNSASRRITVSRQETANGILHYSQIPPRIRKNFLSAAALLSWNKTPNSASVWPHSLEWLWSTAFMHTSLWTWLHNSSLNLLLLLYCSFELFYF